MKTVRHVGIVIYGIVLPPTHFLHATYSMTTKFHEIKCGISQQSRNKALPTFSDSCYSRVSSLRPQVEALPVRHED